MSIFSWWRELRDAQRKNVELKAVEQEKFREIRQAIETDPNLDAPTMCAALESITINVRGTGKVKKEKPV